MKEDSAIEEIFGRFRLFGQDAYHDDEDLDTCWPVAADSMGRLRFVKVMLSSMIAIQFRVVCKVQGRQVMSDVPCGWRCACSVLLCMYVASSIFNLSVPPVIINKYMYMLWGF